VMTIQEFAEWISQLEHIEVVAYDDEKVIFLCTDEKLVIKLTDVAEKSQHILSIKKFEEKLCFCLHQKDYSEFVRIWYGENKKGVPDLSWVTIRQMANELKKRDNITFALIWIEESGYDNISLEASGNPTTLCGMLTRGLNLAVRHADKTIDYHEPKDDK